MAEADNLRTARETIDAWNAHDPNRLAKLVDESFVAERLRQVGVLPPQN